ncbi:MAG: PaaI family thioesterase [Pseudomonadota bacterium]|jgi:acyl-coenzyme A thioesterase PaaI-like protein
MKDSDRGRNDRDDRIKVTEGEWTGWYPCRDPFENQAGPFYFRIDEKGGLCAFRVAEKHLNGAGTLHGGCVMGFADFCVFVIARQELEEQEAVTATFNCELVGAARPGQLVECRGDVVKNTRSMIFVRGLMSADGEPILSFSSAVKKRRARAG